MFHIMTSMQKATSIITSQVPTNIPGLVSEHAIVKSINHQASAARKHPQIPQNQSRKF